MNNKQNSKNKTILEILNEYFNKNKNINKNFKKIKSISNNKYVKKIFLKTGLKVPIIIILKLALMKRIRKKITKTK
jgi:hypothetical protein